jgi:predicted O-methyltransferase YrrM
METPKHEPHFSRNWVHKKTKLWSKLLKQFVGKEKVRYLEIGVFEGRSAIWMMNNIFTADSARGIGVDPYIFGSSDLMAKRDIIKETAKANLEPLGNKFQLLVCDSLTYLLHAYGHNDEFDVIYVDGNHNCMDAYVDMTIGFQILKEGGVMIVDDYGLNLNIFGRTPYDSPKPAFDRFVTEHAHHISEYGTTESQGWLIG